ncbi:hypothetical protein J3454_03430 [Erythrobacter sp. NFXS35]|uniref:hypothetical protein n=1 Tax=Erythrobacter sp. NFXS35 TaxID=2818436 RepID=UPI0032DFCCBB
MDIDDRVLLLGAAAVHPDLVKIDGAAIADRALREQRETRLATGLALVAALGVGLVSGIAPGREEGSAAMPFGPPVALTPLIALSRG